MADAPRAPYPPDPDDDASPPTGLDAVADAVVEHRELANIRVVKSSLRRVELRLCRLTGAELAEASWQDAVLADCRLDLAGLRHATLERVVFRDCRMEECELTGARLRDVRFERCVLRGATFSGCTIERVQFEGCDLTGLVGVEALRGARMPWNDILENAPLFAQALGIAAIADERSAS
jgi:uncharacterized protein YjbI with pentapeptide repeats